MGQIGHNWDKSGTFSGHISEHFALYSPELHKQHRNKLEDITHRFETIKLTLSEKVESLRGECDDLRHRARASEEALHRDADVKVQVGTARQIGPGIYYFCPKWARLALNGNNT